MNYSNASYNLDNASKAMSNSAACCASTCFFWACCSTCICHQAPMSIEGLEGSTLAREHVKRNSGP